jgi:hypothetical protein
MLKTDGWAYLNISNPVCAWATYRGFLVSVPNDPGVISVWAASMLKTADAVRIHQESVLERCRATFYPERVSRLKGMYCFMDLQSAEAALNWGSHFKVQNLAELSFEEVQKGDRLDSNWITYGDFHDELNRAAFGYWSGQPMPNRDPIWEVIVEGRLIVLGTELRERAYALIERNMPDSVAILELARVAAWAGSNLGSTFAFLQDDGDYLVLNYIMDMKEGNDPDFIRRISELGSSGHPMRPEAVKAFKDDTVRRPDLRPFGFRRLKAEMPFVVGAPLPIPGFVG